MYRTAHDVGDDTRGIRQVVTRFGPETAFIDMRLMPLLGAAAYLDPARCLSPAAMRPAAQI
jgi:hypothetical protein